MCGVLVFKEQKQYTVQARPEENQAGCGEADHGQNLMPEFLPVFIGVAEQIAEQCPGKHAATMAPVVDSRHQKPEDANSYGPATDLTEDILTINAATTFSLIEQGSYQTANGRRGSDCYLHPGDAGEKKSTDST